MKSIPTVMSERFSLWLLLVAPHFSLATFSLFLPVPEVRSLLGVSRELYYVNDGDAKENALSFELPLAPDVDQMHFAWMATQDQVPYSLRILSSDPEALHQPHVNISHRGVIPKKRKASVWRVTLPCSGRKKASVLVSIHLAVNDESYTIKRKKECLKKEFFPSSSLGTRDVHDGNDDHQSSPPPHVIFYGMLAGALGAVASLAAAVSTANCRRQRQVRSDGGGQVKAVSSQQCNDGDERYHRLGQQHQAQDDQFQFKQFEQHQPYHHLPPPTLPPPPPPVPSSSPNPPPPPLPQHVLMQHYRQHVPAAVGGPGIMLSDPESRVTDWVQSQQHLGGAGMTGSGPPGLGPVDPEEAMQLLEVERPRLKMGQLLQEGTFGRIYQGTLMGDDEREGDVLIKTVVAGSSQSQSHLLIKEATALYGMIHHHVQIPIASTWDGTSPMVVYPYLSCGNLKRWLQLHNHGGLSTHVLVNIGLQLLKAMQHLHKRRILHKDIATRNCFLGERNLLKLCDSALSRDLFPSDYHCLGDNENRPIKWMPMEAIGKKKYSKASDVWSFGVFLWELMTRAQQPFSDVDPFEMESYLLNDFRLHQPLNCPDQLYSVLTSCWATRPGDRASVHALYSSLQALQKQLQQFV